MDNTPSTCRLKIFHPVAELAVMDATAVIPPPPGTTFTTLVFQLVVFTKAPAANLTPSLLAFTIPTLLTDLTVKTSL